MLNNSWKTQIKAKVYRLFPNKKILTDPVFIIGCGRSGTTILGTLLSQHPQLAYLNEPRYIWYCEPKTDIWTEEAQRRSGKLQLTAKDLNKKTAAKIKQKFALQVRLQNGRRLVEKLPINSFRIDFINSLFPDARFVHLIRNGIEVAKSIAKLSETQAWFGVNNNNYKWQLLSEYASARGQGELVPLCTDNFLQGMLEWRLSVESAIEGLSNIESDRWLEIRYEDLLEKPIAVCTRLEQFIGVEPSQEMRQFAATQITRKSPPASRHTLSPTVQQIAGELLMRLNYTYASEELPK